MITLATYSC